MAEIWPVTKPTFAEMESIVEVEFVLIAAVRLVWPVAKVVLSGVIAVSAFLKIVVAEVYWAVVTRGRIHPDIGPVQLFFHPIRPFSLLFGHCDATSGGLRVEFARRTGQISKAGATHNCHRL